MGFELLRDFPKGHANPFSFPNHLLSKKLLSFEDYPRDNAYCNNLQERIAKDIYGYTDRSPVYYTSSYRNAQELDDFIRSSDFNIFITELKTCVESINNWIREKKIVLKLQQEGSDYTVHSALQNFVDRLQGDTFAEHRSYLYAFGKKDLEIIATLIREESISLEFRKEVITLLFDDNNFDRCSGACLTNLSDAVVKLKNYDCFLPMGLIKSFVATMAREVALSNTVHDWRSYSGILCDYAGYKTATHEIHAVHYLFERLTFDLKLFMLSVPADPYLERLKVNLYRRSTPEQEDGHYVRYVRQFERQFNVTNLVRFISHQLYEACSIYLGDYSALQNFIETQFSKLGKDSEFSWAEIFTEEGDLKKVEDFMITIAERLLDSRWLEFPRQPLKLNNFFNWFRKAPPFKVRIYPNNIALSWVKREGERQAILDMLKTEEGVEWLNSHIFSDPKNLNDLLQNIKDLGLFFKHLPVSHHLSILEKLNAIDFDIPATVTDKLDGSINFIDFHLLFTSLSAPARKFMVSNYPKLVYSILNDILEHVENLNHNQVLLLLNFFIRRITNAGFRDFSGLHFKKRDIRYDAIERDSYLDNIDFSNAILVNTVFYENITNCCFQHANLRGARFIDTRISDTDFKYANLLNCSFERAYVLKSVFIRANLKNTDFLNSSLIKVILKVANLDNVNFFKTELISVHFEDAKLSKVNFKQVELFNASFEETRLNQVNFNNSEIFGSNFDYSDLNEVNFSTSELVSVVLDKSMIRDILVSVSQLNLLHKQGVSDFSGIRLTDNWRNELMTPPDRLKFFSRVMRSSNRQHFFCCEKRNFSCLNKESSPEKRAARKEREVEVLEWKLDALERQGKNPFYYVRKNLIEIRLLETKYFETKLLKSELLGLELWRLKAAQHRLPVRKFLEKHLSESYSNDHASPKVQTAPRSFQC